MGVWWEALPSIQPNLKEQIVPKLKNLKNQIRIQYLVLQWIRTYILTQGDRSFGSKNINHQGQADGHVRDTTPTLLPQSTPSSPPSEGVPVWKDHPKATPLDDFAKLLPGRGIWSAQWCSCSQDQETLQNSHTVSSPPTTYSPLPLLRYLVFPSSFSHPLGKSKPLVLDELCNHPDWIATEHTLHKNHKAKKRTWARFPRQPHPNFRATPTAAQPPSSLACVRACPREKGQRAKRDTCGWPSPLTLRSLIFTGCSSQPLLAILQLIVPDISPTILPDISIHSDTLRAHTPGNRDLFVCLHPSAKRRLPQLTGPNLGEMALPVGG